MLNRIPREVLWIDKTMEELMDMPLFKALHEVFIIFVEQQVIYPGFEVIILNEVGYQVTWLCYESRFGMEPDMDQFEREVYAHVGVGMMDHAEAVISLVRTVVKLVNNPPLNISRQTKNQLAQMNRNSWCRRYVDSFVRRVTKDGYVFSEQFLPAQSDYIPPKKEEPCDEVFMCAEASMEEQQDGVRRFTLDEIVEYTKENVSLEESRIIQLLLFNLLVNDGTREERTKVSSITAYILNRNAGDQVQGNKTSFGNYSNMLNFNLPENADYEKFFAALPENVKQMMIMKLISSGNG